MNLKNHKILLEMTPHQGPVNLANVEVACRISVLFYRQTCTGGSKVMKV